MVTLAPSIELVDWAQLQAGEDLSAQVARAYGEGAMGILLVRGVPGAPELRCRLLPLARALARLPAETLERLERPEALYCFGWSHGKEKFKGAPDLAKGSFYANPLFDDAAMGDEEVRAKYPYAASKNAWPAELPELEAAFKAMGRLLGDVGKLILQQCDSMILAQTGRQAGLVETTFGSSRMVAGRLLHYFPMTEGSDEAGDAANWCGWHNDNSSITGLVPAMWLDDCTGEEAAGPPSGDCGLYVQTRAGSVAKVSMPPDCLGFQVGEAAQILSGGVLRATPHHVRGHVSRAGEPRLSRETFACFFEPQWDRHIGPPAGTELANIFRDEETELIPALSKRFKPDPTTKTVEFGKLLGDSIGEYYKHNPMPGA
mmetsp:Transcript_69386/g.206688  ORF Transcript_69386/g.206688 Transcript_69386/m.206688 type:complete len:373 (+) Transcript_69386:102-1220(+)